MKRVALYVRVSSKEQKLYGYSIDNQIEALKEYAERNNYVIVDIYNDAGISARKKYTKRPELLRLIEDVKNGKVELILFTRLDRWFRNVASYYEVQTVLEDYHVKWRAIWEDYETETSNGILKVNIMLSVAQQEADKTAERIKAVNSYRKSQGEFMGGDPCRGYIKVNNRLQIDPDAEPYIRKFFDTYLSTFSPTKAIESVADKYKISRTVCVRMLKNPSYHGDAYGSPCPAYITEEQHQKIIESITGRRARERTKRTYIFSSLIICPECGGTMSGRLYSHKQYIYKTYHCRANTDRRGCKYGVSVNEQKLEEYLLEKLDEIIDEKNLTISTTIKSQINVSEEIDKLKKRLKRLSTLFEYGDIEEEEYFEKRKAIQSKIASMEETIPKKIVVMPKGWQNMYNELTDENKRSFWKASVKNIRVYGKGNEKKYKVEF